LLRVRYSLGPRMAAVMVGGGLLAWVLIIPGIAWWGEGFTAPVFPESAALIRDMSASELWSRYVRYIGAGAVATAGIVTLIRSIPVMVQSFRIGTAQIRERVGDDCASAAVLCIDNDLQL